MTIDYYYYSHCNYYTVAVHSIGCSSDCSSTSLYDCYNAGVK